MNKKGLGFITLYCCFLLISCGKINEVEIRGADNLRYNGFKNNQVEFEADIRVFNPSSHKIKVREIDMKLLVNDMYLGRLQNAEEFYILPRSDEFISVSFRLRIANLFTGLSTISGLYHQRNLKVEVNGFVKAKTAFYKKKIDVREITYIDALK
ncbi:MAG: LEA type 2 family protein [Bacteroidales bacterium]|nr:LEA type 2 family protein [Bacteroidales bacterium]